VASITLGCGSAVAAASGYRLRHIIIILFTVPPRWRAPIANAIFVFVINDGFRGGVARGCCDRRPYCHGRRCFAVQRIVGYPTNDIRLTGAHTTHNGGGGGGKDRELQTTTAVCALLECYGGAHHCRLGPWYPIQLFED